MENIIKVLKSLEGANEPQRISIITFLLVADSNMKIFDMISEWPIGVQLEIYKTIEKVMDEAKIKVASVLEQFVEGAE